ncbi:N-terminal EF-hand calcium-binding protein 1 [Larimichthys crocea]|uniref:Uncharacterized protein n=1 Tax=Larimichthys crocea TaxID=215358 RepID=A0ACD3RJC2_LARCR|nr:N-terminal EF-hand calcium-binding protein 1 [Larimichthys crocea]
MLACTEMITMCLQSAKQKHLRAQQQQQPLHTTGQGLTIFHDIFRRADKNDDGKLSFDEFNAYFADGILTTEELQELFYSIDGRQNKSTRDSSVLGQFVTRFMLRETSSQLLSLQRSLQCAMEAVEEQSSPSPREAKAPELTAVQKNGRRCGRRVHNNLCMSPSDPCSGILTTGVSMEDDENWCSQINRLQQLLDKLECQGPKLEPLKEDTLASTYKSNILLVQRQMSVTDENLDNFRKVLKGYIDATSAHSDNLQQVPLAPICANTSHHLRKPRARLRVAKRHLLSCFFPPYHHFLHLGYFIVQKATHKADKVNVTPCVGKAENLEENLEE